MRAVRSDEGSRLRDVRLRALLDSPEAFGSTFEHEERFPDDVWQERAERAAGGTDRVTFVAERYGRWIGMATAVLDDEELGVASVYGVWVEPAARGLGVGTGLMNAVERWSAVRAARGMSLWVVTSNEAALALYQRLGFELTGEQKPMPRDPSVLEIRLLRTLR